MTNENNCKFRTHKERLVTVSTRDVHCFGIIHRNNFRARNSQ